MAPLASLGQGATLLERLHKANLTMEEMQVLVENSDIVIGFARGRYDREVLLSIFMEAAVNPYHKDGKSRTSFCYRYEPRKVEDTLAMMVQGDYCGTGFDDTSVLRLAAELEERRTETMEGPFVIPKLSSVASRVFDIQGGWSEIRERYGEILENHLFPAIEASRSYGLHNYQHGRIGSDRLCFPDRDWKMLCALEDDTPGDFLVFLAQTGMLYRGCSIEYSRWEIEHATDPKQFGMTTWIGGNIILHNPQRFTHSEDLGVDMAGECYRYVAEPQFVNVPYFASGLEKLTFGPRHVSSLDGSFGAGSVFVFE